MISQNVFRETRVGIILGCISGLLVALIGYMWMNNAILGAVIAVSMVGGMTFATTVGALMPIMSIGSGLIRLWPPVPL